jgi:hypothetical protein
VNPHRIPNLAYLLAACIAASLAQGAQAGVLDRIFAKKKATLSRAQSPASAQIQPVLFESSDSCWDDGSCDDTYGACCEICDRNEKASCIRRQRKIWGQTYYPAVPPYCCPCWGWYPTCWRRMPECWCCPQPRWESPVPAAQEPAAPEAAPPAPVNYQSPTSYKTRPASGQRIVQVAARKPANRLRNYAQLLETIESDSE